MKILSLLAVITIVVLSGCSSVKPYAELTVGYTFNQQIYQDKFNNCNWAFQGKLGLENYKGLSVGIAHDSNVDCGPPLDADKEPFRDYVYVTQKLGGAK